MSDFTHIDNPPREKRLEAPTLYTLVFRDQDGHWKPFEPLTDDFPTLKDYASIERNAPMPREKWDTSTR